MTIQQEAAAARYATVPTWLRDAKRWLLWESQAQASGKPRKVPYYVDGTARGATDTNNDWARLVSFEEACAALDAYPGGYTGPGFALGPDGTGNFWQGIDLDDCVSRPQLFDLLPQLPGYVEFSPSGMGFHAIGYGARFQLLGSNAMGVEAYCSGRFFTVTGSAVALNDSAGICLAATVANILKPIHDEGRRNKGSSSKASFLPPTEPPPDLIADLRSALATLSPDGRSDWISVGQALYSLKDAGFTLWAEWSAKSPKFQGDDDLRVWSTFSGERTGYAAVFARAQDGGWVNPRRRADPATLFGHAPLPPGALSVRDGDDGEIVEVPIADLFTNPPEPPEFLIEEMLPAGLVTLLGAHGGAGKSMLALQAAVCLASGIPFFGKKVRRSRVIFYSAEDTTSVIRHRLNRICRHMAIDPAILAEWLKIFDATSKPVLFAETKIEGIKSGVPLSSYKWLSQEAEKFAADAIVVDNASDTFDANEIERARVREFIKLLPRLRRANPVAVLLLAHVDKLTARGVSGTEGYSGSTAWHNSARSRWSLVTQGDLLLLQHHKSNLGKLADPITLCWNSDGILEQVEIASETENRFVVLHLIGELYSRSIFISPAPTASNNAYKVMQSDPRFPRTLTRQGLNGALQSAVRDRQLLIENYTGLNRHAYRRYCLAPTALREVGAPQG